MGKSEKVKRNRRTYNRAAKNKESEEGCHSQRQKSNEIMSDSYKHIRKDCGVVEMSGMEVDLMEGKMWRLFYGSDVIS